MRNFLLLSILAFVLFTYGCIGGSDSNSTQPAANEQHVQEETQAAAPESGSSGSEAVSGNEETSSDETPMLCEYSIFVDDNAATVRVWLLGDMRKIVTESKNYSATIVYKDNKIYNKLVDKEGSNCDWMVVEENTGGDSSSTIAATYTVDSLQTGSHADCHPANFGEEVFATDGEVCNLRDLYPAVSE